MPLVESKFCSDNEAPRLEAAFRTEKSRLSGLESSTNIITTHPGRMLIFTVCDDAYTTVSSMEGGWLLDSTLASR